MTKTLIIFLLSLSATASAQEITSCKDPKGHGYFHHHPGGLMSKSESGWSEEKITGGITTLKKLPDGNYDILIVDIRKRIISFRQDGGEIILLRKGADDATFLHMYPGNVIELYTFWRDNEGKYRFDMLQSKGGAAMQIHKSSVMTGYCSEINFEMIK
jgi:hypothetical protein